MRPWAWIAAALVVSAANAAPIAFKDDLGREVVLAAPARRIVTLAPFLTELVFAAGAGDRIVGVSAFSDYPPEAKNRPVVSSAAGVSLEQVAALSPDLVLAWRDSFRREDIERLERLHIPIAIVHGRRMDQVPQVLSLIGAATGRDVQPLIAEYRARIAALRAAYSAKARVEVFVEIWHRPLTTIAGAHFMNDALDICGARNTFADHAGVAPVVSWEEVYARDPPVVVGSGSARDEAEFRDNWRKRSTLAAVRDGRLVWADADKLQRPTLRLPEGIRKLCEQIDAIRLSRDRPARTGR
jgi:iron complex transport system substrate-binding protein